MDKDVEKKLIRGNYEVGYGKPPTAGQFVRGKSGNPRGRKAKSAQKMEKKKKADPDHTTRERFLKATTRLVTIRENDTVVEIPLLDAVIRAEAVAALKGSPNAQRNIIEREARYRNELKAEIEADHAYWRDYIDSYHKAVSALKKKGESVPLDWIHPEDIVFKDASHVLFRGGDPAEAHRKWQHVVRLRDAHMLQAVKDERHSAGSSQRTPVFLSSVLAAMLNSALPKRLQLDDGQYSWQWFKNSRLKTRDLAARLRKEWTELGHPEWGNILTPALKDDALERLRAFDPLQA
jgi:Family of unknown function (DUF5681)